MEPLPTLASALAAGSGARAQGPLLPVAPFAKGAAASTSTGGLFEREVERALERQDESGGERVAEARASAIRERRAQRDAGFDGDRRQLEPRSEREAEPTQALVESPSAPAREAAPVSSNTTSANAAGGESSTSGGPASSAAKAGGSEVATAPPPATPQVGLPTTGAPGTTATLASAGAGATGAGPVAATGPAAAVVVNEATATFLQAARGARGAAVAANVAGTPGDTALVDHAAEVLRQIRLSLSPAAKRVVIDLHPAELGRLSIRMAIHEGRVSAVVRAESPQTFELLERHLPELRAVLAERGVETGSVELELASDGQPGERRGHAAARRPAAGLAANPTEHVAHDEPRSSSLSRTPIDGSVDTYA